MKDKESKGAFDWSENEYAENSANLFDREFLYD